MSVLRFSVCLLESIKCRFQFCCQAMGFRASKQDSLPGTKAPPSAHVAASAVHMQATPRSMNHTLVPDMFSNHSTHAVQAHLAKGTSAGHGNSPLVSNSWRANNCNQQTNTSLAGRVPAAKATDIWLHWGTPIYISASQYKHNP